MQNDYRVILLTGRKLRGYVFESLRKICECDEVRVVAVFVNTRHESLTKKFVGLARRRGLFTALTTAFDHVVEWLTDKDRRAQFFAEELTKYCGARLHYVEDLYDERSISLLSSYEPDLGFHWGFGWIKEPILSLPRNGVIGYHHGDLTAYRGSLPYFWELYNREKRVGVTVQRLAPRLDAGEIVMQRFFDVKETDTLRSLRHRVASKTVDMGLESVLLMKDPSFVPVKPFRIGRFYSFPNLWQWIRFQLIMTKRVLLCLMKGAKDQKAGVS